MRHVTDEERRARLAARHRIMPGARAPDAVSATRAMTVLHATEPPTVYLSLAARVDGLAREDIDRELYVHRSLVKQLAMRRTLFVFPRDLLPAAWASASARVAIQEATRLARDAVRGGLAPDGAAWLAEREQEVLGLLAGGGLQTSDIRKQVPDMDAKVPTGGVNSKWGGPTPIGPRVLTWLGARGLIVRGRNGGHWRISRAEWTPMETWLGELPARPSEDEAYAELVRRWLHTFGPGTTRDIQWWLGATLTAVRRALAAVDAVEVSLDGGGTGWLLADDVDEVEEPGPWAALLPVLDPTTMGWKERGFYLDPADVPYLFDSNGNAGTTAWWNGRIVGCWVQDAAGKVRVVSRHTLPADAEAALAAEAERLTAWLDGEIVNSLYASKQMKSERLP
ncbi:hypothetical protein BJ980_001195 [Nocardioides daedukensis]|uniref:Winged helix DNA-binding domain-containing protein n=1 Tax=Nocardioides daedukensis TaxID=634462 RepID=A0A7Y9UPH9_9ACTN|nr:winged helix DNA-binding domain-containing protein [Nocardioides daedukensis]NYG58272.1 hypothetical protein [Nocardioides daedukensis]